MSCLEYSYSSADLNACWVLVRENDENSLFKPLGWLAPCTCISCWRIGPSVPVVQDTSHQPNSGTTLTDWPSFLNSSCNQEMITRSCSTLSMVACQR
jgi:hypothetical protein